MEFFQSQHIRVVQFFHNLNFILELLGLWRGISKMLLIDNLDSSYDFSNIVNTFPDLGGSTTAKFVQQSVDHIEWLICKILITMYIWLFSAHSFFNLHSLPLIDCTSWINIRIPLRPALITKWWEISRAICSFRFFIDTTSYRFFFSKFGLLLLLLFYLFGFSKFKTRII